MVKIRIHNFYSACKVLQKNQKLTGILNCIYTLDSFIYGLQAYTIIPQLVLKIIGFLSVSIKF